MPMKLPKPESDAISLFETLLAREPRLVSRKMFGQPAAFLNGNLCLGVFGPDLFVRLSEKERARVSRVAGSRNLEPMPGRPMRDYWILPAAALRARGGGTDWVAKAVEVTAKLPPK